MAIREADVRWVAEPKLGLFERLYLPVVVDGLTTTVGHIFAKKRTEQYPEQEPDLPPNYRGVHRLNRDAEGRVKCVACYMCATACPAHCIDIVAAPAPANWAQREKYPETFVIDELRCIYCGMCEEACPVDAIELTSALYDLSGLSREQMLFDKEKLLSVFDQTSGAGGKDPVRTQGGSLGPAAEAPPVRAPQTAQAVAVVRGHAVVADATPPAPAAPANGTPAAPAS